jgi:hypothetical protein
MCEQRRNFGARKHDWHALGFFGAHQVIEPLERHVKHVTVQKHECAERLPLSRSADAVLRSEARKEALDLVATELARMATAVKADEAPYPVQVRFFGSRTAVANAQRAAYLVEQARRAYVTRWLLRGWWTAHRTGVIGTRSGRLLDRGGSLRARFTLRLYYRLNGSAVDQAFSNSDFVISKRAN